MEQLQVAKTANFYRLGGRITNDAISALFVQMRASARSPSQNLFRHDRVGHGKARWSAISFFHERDPSFLQPPPAMKERICCFLLLIEYERHVVLFKAGIDIPAGFRTRHLQRVPSKRVEGAIARADAVFRKIRLRSMSMSKLALRVKTLEADDLENSVGPAGSSRYVPQGYSVRTSEQIYSATPSTGRISLRSDRSRYQELIDWSIQVIDQLARGDGAVAPFIQNFARPIDLSEIDGEAVPTYFAVNVAGLEERLDDPATIKLVREQEEGFVDVGRAEAALILQELAQILTVRVTRQQILLENNGAAVGTLAFNKSRIALRSLSLPLMSEIQVETLEDAGGAEPERQPLRRYLDQEELFTILFDDFSIVYVEGTLYRDTLLRDGGGSFLRHIKTDARLADAVSEKGSFAEGQAAFTADSVFAAVVESIAAADDILICDDLGDEWADFIGINRTADPTSISFYHAKHGALSLGASPFHISVSQALKNLGRMALPAEALPGKLNTWLGDSYRNDGVQTAVRRVMRGDEATLAADLDQARTAPDAIRKVYIVTSSLSRKQVEAVLAGIKEGRAPDPHFVQLYWLLSTFFSQASEVGAFGYLVCQE
jgi:hypothetical protein